MGNTSGKSKGKSTSNSEVELKSSSVNEVASKPDKAPPTPQAKEKISQPVASTSENSSSESKDTVIFKPQQPQHPNAFGFTFKPMRPQATPTAPQQSSSTSIPYSPPPPYNPAAAAEKLKNPNPLKSKHVQVYDPPPEEPEEIHVIEVRDSACQTKESFTERYLRDVYFGGPRVYRPPSSARSSPTVPQVPVPQVSLGKRAPLARGEAVEMVDVPRKHMRKVPRGPADVLMFPKSPSSIASVDASTGSLELLSELDELEELRDKTIREPEDDDDDEEDEPANKRTSISGLIFFFVVLCRFFLDKLCVSCEKIKKTCQFTL